MKSFFIKRALKQYQRRLPIALKTNYGGSGRSGYTEGQVRTTVNELNLNTKYINYALLMFCGEEALREESSESVLKMIEFLGSNGSDGGAGDVYSPYYDSSSDSFDGGGSDGGGDG